jgi:hypothetical protein
MANAESGAGKRVGPGSTFNPPKLKLEKLKTGKNPRTGGVGYG